ncbi:MAG: 3'-5' exonuclease [Pseudomonadota bacterium]
MEFLSLRRRLARRKGAAPRELAEAWEQPLLRGGTPVESLPFLVCDAEMSGLDPKRDELLSIGWVAIDNAELCLDSTAELLLNSESGVGQSATIHRLRDCELRDGLPLELALRRFLRAATGRVLVFHNAALDMAFLNRAARRCWDLPLLLPCIDTLRVEERRLRLRNEPLTEGCLRLPDCRARYGLGPHRGHAALTDALATGELLLAQIAARGSGLLLRDLR